MDERSKRRATFVEGVGVDLGGQVWHFPRPTLRLFPGRDPEGRIRAHFSQSYGPDFDRKFRELIDLPDADFWPKVALQVELAADLLLRNYDLDDDELRELLTFDHLDDESVRRWSAIVDVLACRPPKRSADGSDSP